MESEDVELYTILGLDPTRVDVLSLSDRDIARAYRKAALKWHPDKNRDNPNAAAKFSAVFVAYETLSTPSHRAKYDAAIRAARAHRERLSRLDAGRRRLRDDLRRREAAADAAAVRPANLDAAALERMRKEIERLRTDALREEEDELKMRRGGDSRVDSRPERERSAGAWAKVKGYQEFRSSGAVELDFAEFERAVLAGEFP